MHTDSLDMDQKWSLEFSKPMLYKASTSLRPLHNLGCRRQPSMPCTRGQIPCCFRMTDAVERLETDNEHAATIVQALPLVTRHALAQYGI